MGTTPTARAQRGATQIGGARLAFEVAGKGAGVVLIHSGITDSRSWEPQFAEFARSFRVVRYDMRGFGQSDVSHGEYSARDDLAAVLEAARVERVALVGVSIGSALAVDFALEHPDRVTALVVVGPGISGRVPSEGFEALMDGIDQIYDAKGLDAAIEREMEVWLYGKGRTAADVEPRVRDLVFVMDRFNSARVPDDLKARPLEPPAIGRLGEIRVPTLIVVGDRDVDDIFDAAERLETGIAGARRVVMRATAHVPNMEQPSEFNRIVLEFLRLHLPGPAV